MDHHQPHLFAVALALAAPAAWSAAPAPAPSPPATSVAAPERPRNLTAFLGLSLPTPLAAQAVLRQTPALSFAATAGYAWLPIGSSKSVSAGGLELAARWHPWKSAFYLSGGVGYQYVGADLTLNLQSNQVELQAGMHHLYVAPALGFLWHFHSHWAIGVDLGIQIPVIAFSTAQGSGSGAAAPLATSAAADANADLNYFASLVIPEMGLIRVGYEF